MRYIRTNYGIFDIEKDFVIEQFKTYEIIKQADTIEELCDEFILVAPYRFRRPKTATELEKDFEEMKYFYTDKNDTIYGAIWIELDNGAMRLEPVAKMNEKGELELL